MLANSQTCNDNSAAVIADEIERHGRRLATYSASGNERGVSRATAAIGACVLQAQEAGLTEQLAAALKARGFSGLV